MLSEFISAWTPGGNGGFLVSGFFVSKFLGISHVHQYGTSFANSLGEHRPLGSLWFEKVEASVEYHCAQFSLAFVLSNFMARI